MLNLPLALPLVCEESDEKDRFTDLGGLAGGGVYSILAGGKFSMDRATFIEFPELL